MSPTEILNTLILASAGIGALIFLGKMLAKAVRAADEIADMTSEEGWPNGSKSMKESHMSLYTKVGIMQIQLGDIQKSLETLLEAERRFHGDL